MDPSDVPGLQQSLSEQWQVAIAPGEDVRAQAIAALKEKILYLLKNNPDRLMAGLYILDVPEELYKRATFKKGLDEAAGNLAELVVEREIKKAEMRRMYAKKQYDESDRQLE